MMEKEMAIHSSMFAWKIPWAGIRSMRSQRVRQTEHAVRHKGMKYHTPTWMKFVCTILTEKSPSLGITYGMVPFIGNVQNMQVCRDAK